ncbi:unnamed protein product [Meloidogyne enterolobii]|uniref:Uncharacterized protein n=1 Tax=Meloidogyne enterolobii TaxID=390850 RepID=A0ACB0XWB6_MELEN
MKNFLRYLIGSLATENFKNRKPGIPVDNRLPTTLVFKLKSISNIFFKAAWDVQIICKPKLRRDYSKSYKQKLKTMIWPRKD